MAPDAKNLVIKENYTYSPNLFAIRGQRDRTSFFVIMTRIRTIYGKMIAPKIIEDSSAIVC